MISFPRSPRSLRSDAPTLYAFSRWQFPTCAIAYPRCMRQQFSSIESAIVDLRQGKMIIVVDDADRENEGDLIMAAQFVTPENVNFMAKHGRGLICVPTISERLQQLGMQRLGQQNREKFKTDIQINRGARAA